jgi:hypothetical protein
MQVDSFAANVKEHGWAYAFGNVGPDVVATIVPLLAPAKIAAAVARATSAIRSLRGASAAAKAADTATDTIRATEGDGFLYRGVHDGHPDMPNAVRGRAEPWGGHADPARHTGGNNQSEFTSWTRDPGIAYDCAMECNGPGIVLRIPDVDAPDLPESLRLTSMARARS